MRGQPHLIESAIPIAAGRDWQALCGKFIADAHFGFSWDVQTMGQLGVSARGVCPKCLGIAMSRTTTPKTPRYLYGAIPGNEMKKREGMDDATD